MTAQGKAKGRVLVIDDEEGIRFSFRLLLSKEGFEVVIAADYLSALEILSTTDVDVVFADIILGGHTGVDVLRAVKNLGLRCPVIIMTGEPSVETASDAVRLGAFAYLSKPVGKDLLLSYCKAAFKHKILADEKYRIELENEKNRRNLAAVFRSVRDGIVTVDHEMRIITANEAMRDICGPVSVDLDGKFFKDVFKLCRVSCREVLKKALEKQEMLDEERVECGRLDRPNQIVALTGSSLTDMEDKNIGAVMVLRDVTRLNYLERELKERRRFHKLIGRSARMQYIYRLVEDLADTDTTVLITGESGTGKELVAQALHYSGPRAVNSLVSVNCSALAENLLESELFGHVQGAFTGALKDKKGRFEAADGGTILLDEIGDISPKVQLQLLRVLQEKQFERVGDSTPIKVDVRVILCTNRDLKELVSQSRFREDLYYRIKVMELIVPALRKRREDIPLLAEHFISVFNHKFRKAVQGISSEVLEALMQYPWPGNVRELKHAMEHAFILCRGQLITLGHLPVEIREHTPANFADFNTKTRSSLEPEDVLLALNKTNWNKSKAARLLGIGRRTIYRKIDEYNLSEP
ncbi:MAG: sigma 54-interacting transcriptional regulator, partial [Thermodesulfobacteriota bacterium]|nr:sigma 54-interacting transcriptional regulator [Thermodesulfobacteriota bacterium]